ncbi:hypothetical protein HZS_798 [Henneguya salminicola]|nr:hypothetical protein HZS_798 [Henneguya salminicola]
MLNAPQKYIEEFIHLLKMTISPDNIQRKECEARLNAIDKETKLNLLLQVLINEKGSDILEISSLMLRQAIYQCTDVKQFNEATLNTLKNTMPQLCLQQQDRNLRCKYVDIISSLATLCYEDDKNHWPEVNSFFYECLVRSNHDIGKEIGLRIIETAPCILGDFNDEFLGNIFKVITETMSANIQTHKLFVINSLKAFSSLFVDLSSKRSKKYINTPLQIILHVIKNSNDVDTVSKFLEELNVMIECKSRALKEYIVPIAETMVGLLASQHTAENIRIECMECLVSMAEHCKKSFKSAAKAYLPAIIDVFIRHITLIQEDPSWIFSIKEDGEDEEDDLPTVAETSLDRLTCALGGKTMFPLIMDKVPSLLSSKIWQHRCAALITLSCIAEGCIKIMKPHLSKIVEVVVPFIKDEHPRVIYSCINTLGQLTVDYSGYFHTNFHSQVFPAIFYCAETSAHYPRVQAQAVCCFVNLLEGCPKKVVEMYQDQFFHNLHSLFISAVNTLDKPGVPLVLENALSSISKFSECLKIDFVKYYRNIVPELLTLIRSFSSTPHPKYYIISLETLSSILLAVGSKECIHELDSVLEILKSFEIKSIKPTENDKNYHLDYLEIMSSIAEVFGDSFSPILPTLIPVLLELVSVPIENQIISSSIKTESSDSNTLTRAFSAHTDAINDKNKACLILQKLIKNLKASMSNYIDDICNVTIKNFLECYDEDIQCTACDTFPLILKCAQLKATNYEVQIWPKIFQAFYTRVLKSDGILYSDIAFDAIRDCIKVLSYNAIAGEVLIKIVEMMNVEISRLIQDYGNNSPATLHGNDTDENDLYEDDEDMDDFEDAYEENTLSSIENLTRTLFKMLKSNYIPYFSQIFPQVLSLLSCSNPILRCGSLVILGDLIEFCPAESVQLCGQFLETIKILLEDKNSSVRQSTIYLIGLLIEFASNQYQTFISFCLPVMVKIITDKDSREDEIVSVTANAIAVVGKIMKYAPDLISPFETAVVTWISWLPVIEDEVDFILTYLCELIETYFFI